jgi:Flp pilus assembly protein TadD
LDCSLRQDDFKLYADDRSEVLARAGLSLFEAGRLAEAEARFQSVLVLSPSHFVALQGLGLLAARQGAMAVAESFLHRAVLAFPTDIKALSNLARIRKTLGRYGEARDCLTTALKIAPDNAELHNDLAGVLKMLNRADAAASHYRAAVVLAPNLESAVDNLGTLQSGLGQTASATILIDRALKLAPENAAYWLDYSLVKRLEPADPRVADLLAKEAGLESLAEEERISLHFALGKIFNDLGEPARAFSHYLAGNTLVRRKVPYDEAGTLDLFRRIRALFTSSFLVERQRQGNPSERPVFVVGMPRSGSTLISQILASHPRAFSVGELPSLSVAVGEMAKRTGCPPFPEGFATFTGAMVRQLGDLYLGQLAAACPVNTADRIVDKLLANFLVVGLIHIVLPNARIIHAVRDPIDTCVSSFCQSFEAPQRHNHDLGELGRYHRAYQDLMDHWRYVLPAHVMVEVRYEDVIADFDGQVRRILDHCGLEWDESCRSFHRHERLVRTASAAQVRQPLYANSVGRWRAVAPQIGPLLEALGL